MKYLVPLVIVVVALVGLRAECPPIVRGLSALVVVAVAITMLSLNHAEAVVLLR